ncbi:hypothetical protein [Streptomyces halobius]|uniref:Uncharacterized protein n=1 Tax=Streptomyces halobius TaxID=2879846 RepID=A0ABY4MG57_9ACTN|nr:hypothetical protein [Streptomyces halobius]UQA96698.1 hypothetical protein K9S39_36835 [Streptomyces halobius]
MSVPAATDNGPKRARAAAPAPVMRLDGGDAGAPSGEDDAVRDGACGEREARPDECGSGGMPHTGGMPYMGDSVYGVRIRWWTARRVVTAPKDISRA